MAEQQHAHPDTSQGWCCDGRTWSEHAQEGGGCCQAQGTDIAGLPPEGQEKARRRLAETSSSATGAI
jgi:hypothetical protein